MDKTEKNKHGEAIETILNIISTRRSVRKFKKERIADSAIKKLIWAATMAPSGGNFQPWHYIVIKNKQVKDTLSAVISDSVGQVEQKNLFLKEHPFMNHIRRYSLFFNDAPVVIAVLVKIYNGLPFEIITQSMKTDKYSTTVLSGFVEVQSVAASIENLILAAHGMGYGSCWMRIPFCAKDALERELKVEKPWHLIAFVPVGLPDEKPKDPGRKPVEKAMTTIE